MGICHMVQVMTSLMVTLSLGATFGESFDFILCLQPEILRGIICKIQTCYKISIDSIPNNITFGIDHFT